LLLLLLSIINLFRRSYYIEKFIRRTWKRWTNNSDHLWKR